MHNRNSLWKNWLHLIFECYFLRLTYFWEEHSEFCHISLLSASSVVRVAVLVIQVHELENPDFWKRIEGRGGFVWLLSSYLSNLFPWIAYFTSDSLNNSHTHTCTTKLFSLLLLYLQGPPLPSSITFLYLLQTWGKKAILHPCFIIFFLCLDSSLWQKTH